LIVDKQITKMENTRNSTEIQSITGSFSLVNSLEVYYVICVNPLTAGSLDPVSRVAVVRSIVIKCCIRFILIKHATVNLCRRLKLLTRSAITALPLVENSNYRLKGNLL